MRSIASLEAIAAFALGVAAVTLGAVAAARLEPSFFLVPAGGAAALAGLRLARAGADGGTGRRLPGLRTAAAILGVLLAGPILDAVGGGPAIPGLPNRGPDATSIAALHPLGRTDIPEPEVVETSASAHSRVDVLALEPRAELHWVFTDGDSPVARPAPDAPVRPEHWWSSRFSTLSLLLRTVRPERFAAVVPRRGPEAILAGIYGIDSPVTYPTAEPGRDPVREMAADPSEYDLLLLASNHLERPDGPRRHFADATRFRRDAIRTYVDHVRPDGWIAITAHDEGLLMRATLMVWEILAEEAPSEEPLDRRSWVARLEKGVTHPSPYRFLALIRRAPIDDETMVRFRSTVGLLPVRALSGPGFPPRTRYSILAKTASPTDARLSLRAGLSSRAGQWLDLDATTSAEPDFFRIVPRPRPIGKWLLAVGVVAVLAVLMLPLAPRRRIDAPDADERAPLPVLLAPILSATAATGLVAMLLAERAAAGPTAVGVLLAGLLAGSRLGAGRPGRLAVAGVASLLVAVAAASLPTIAPPLVGPEASGGVRLASLGAFGLLAGAALGLTLGGVRRRVRSAVPELLPWSAAAFAGAAFAAGPLAHWIVAANGAVSAGLVAAGLGVLTALLFVWIAVTTRTTSSG